MAGKKKRKKAKKARKTRRTPRVSASTLAGYRRQKDTLKKGMYSGKKYRLVEV